MPGATWVGPSINSGDGDGRPGESADAMTAYDWVVVHIAAGTFNGTISWQHNPDADVSSHFIVARDGRIAQMVDTHDRAWTQRAGNPRGISIENEGYLPNPLTSAQVEANARILAWAHTTHGIPLQVTDTPARRGLGHHSMGAENGYDWGHSACPGPAIKAQKPAIVARAREIVGGTVNLSGEDITKVADEVVRRLWTSAWNAPDGSRENAADRLADAGEAPEAIAAAQGNILAAVAALGAQRMPTAAEIAGQLIAQLGLAPRPREDDPVPLPD